MGVMWERGSVPSHTRRMGTVINNLAISDPGEVVHKDKYLIEERLKMSPECELMLGFRGPMEIPTQTREMTKDEIIKHLETELSLVTRKFDKIKDYLGPEMYESIIELETDLAKWREEV